MQTCTALTFWISYFGSGGRHSFPSSMSLRTCHCDALWHVSDMQKRCWSARPPKPHGQNLNRHGRPRSLTVHLSWHTLWRQLTFSVPRSNAGTKSDGWQTTSFLAHFNRNVVNRMSNSVPEKSANWTHANRLSGFKLGASTASASTGGPAVVCLRLCKPAAHYPNSHSKLTQSHITSFTCTGEQHCA